MMFFLKIIQIKLITAEHDKYKGRFTLSISDADSISVRIWQDNGYSFLAKNFHWNIGTTRIPYTLSEKSIYC